MAMSSVHRTQAPACLSTKSPEVSPRRATLPLILGKVGKHSVCPGKEALLGECSVGCGGSCCLRAQLLSSVGAESDRFLCWGAQGRKGRVKNQRGTAVERFPNTSF